MPDAPLAETQLTDVSPSHDPLTDAPFTDARLADARSIEAARRFLDARPPRFGTLATINADGSPHQAVVWYLVEPDAVIVNSAEGRIWPANLRRDPRASLLVEDGYDYVTVRGDVAVVDDPEGGQADIASMARRYHWDDPAEAEELIERRFRRQRRVSFRLPFTAVFTHGEVA